MPFFNSWGLELLVPQLYDLDRRVALEAVEILDEACEEEVRRERGETSITHTHIHTPSIHPSISCTTE